MSLASRARALLTVLCLGVPIVACSAGSDDAISADDALVEKADGLGKDDFDGPLTRDQIRRANANLPNDAFDAKWTASLESPVIFMRSYPGAYHADLGRVAKGRILGEEGICFGDAHPDNFGFVRINGQTRFVFNDLDDSGLCPIGVDVARYFAVLRLYFGDDDLTADVLEQYVDTVKDASRGVPIDSDFVPDLDKHRLKGLGDSTSNGRFVLGSDLGAPTAAEKTALTALAGRDATLSRYTLEDIGSLSRVQGGSGGLRRYWLLVKRGADETILELKEAATPGVDLGRQSRSYSPEERLGILEKALWNERPEGDYYYVNLLGGRFLVRDRLAKKGIDLTSLGNKDLKKVLHAQATIMANVHSPHWQGVKKDDIRAWVSDTSDTLAKRWKDTYKAK